MWQIDLYYPFFFKPNKVHVKKIWFDGEHDHIDRVRCVGNRNNKENPSQPRMHNKCFVFGHRSWIITGMDSFGETGKWKHIADAVWTGSFNCSQSATLSFENAVIIRGGNAASMYLQEICLLFLLSEPLDWKSEWMAPESSFHT